VSELVTIGAMRDDVGHVCHSSRSGRFHRVLVVSLGPSDKLDDAGIRRAAGAVTRWLISEKIGQVALWVDGLASTSVDRAAAEWAMGMALAAFTFDEHRSSNDALAKLRVSITSDGTGHVDRTLPYVQEAVKLAEAVNYARTIAHQPANVINPTTLSAEAEKLAKKHQLKFTVLHGPALKRAGMNGLRAVGDGAAHGPRLIVLEYRGSARSKKNTVLVGKAITFDTGGYSIKPAAGLEGLKFDKCGGATVLGTIKAAAMLKLRCNVIGVIAAAENAISDRAYRPGDILKMMSGKSVEVTNTDAEGRLVLADALWYAQTKCKPTALIDLATLTGGANIALGKAAAPIMGNEDNLVGDLEEAGRRSQERVWRLPLWDDYRELIRCGDADIKNSAGKRDAHCIVGGMFLKEFVKDEVPWAHIDIAAVATTENGNGAKATGFGVRLLVEYLQRQGT
jgi:leucyl aminopeptidase